MDVYIYILTLWSSAKHIVKDIKIKTHKRQISNRVSGVQLRQIVRKRDRFASRSGVDSHTCRVVLFTAKQQNNAVFIAHTNLYTGCLSGIHPELGIPRLRQKNHFRIGCSPGALK